MVIIAKRPKQTGRSFTSLYRKLTVSVAVLLLLWIGIHWFTLLASITLPSTSTGGGSDPLLRAQSDSNQRQQQQQTSREIKGVTQPEGTSSRQSLLQQQQQRLQLTESLLTQLDQLSHITSLSPSPKKDDGDSLATIAEEESKFLSALRKECIPGRDDASGEVNPTTRRKRECLRHVPLEKAPAGADAGSELEARKMRQKPRIGIMIPPGHISHSFAGWIETVLKSTGDKVMNMDIEVLITSHVPVYGYGKSHGFTKLIRFLTLPVALGAYDAYLWSSSEVHGDSSLRDALDEMKLGRNSSPPSAATIGQILQLIMRWNCRLSHVSAHTAMLTLSLEDVIKDPIDALTSILNFIWREDWEWEGRGAKHPSPRAPLPQRDWKRDAENLISVENTSSGGGGGGSLLQALLDNTTIILGETASSTSGLAFQEAMQGAYASEMKRSAGMTAWPCPSFWEGISVGSSSGGGDINKPNIGGGSDGRENEMRALQRLSGEMVPNCSDNDPFVRCTINKDRCEVKRDSKCK